MAFKPDACSPVRITHVPLPAGAAGFGLLTIRVELNDRFFKIRFRTIRFLQAVERGRSRLLTRSRRQPKQ